MIEVSISRKEIDHLSMAARLELAREEQESFAVKLSEVLGQIKTMNQLDLTGVEPTIHLMSITNVFREDVKRLGLDQETALEGAPEEKDGCFRVPRIV